MNPRKLAVAALALTYREAAALLRVDRSMTLHRLIDAGLLQPVQWGSGQRIPREQKLWEKRKREHAGQGARARAVYPDLNVIAVHIDCPWQDPDVKEVPTVGRKRRPRARRHNISSQPPGIDKHRR